MIKNWTAQNDSLVKSLFGRHPGFRPGGDFTPEGESRGPDIVPAKAGNQFNPLDSGFRRNEGKGQILTRYESIKNAPSGILDTGSTILHSGF